jgi:hypothetical protein
MPFVEKIGGCKITKFDEKVARKFGNIRSSVDTNGCFPSKV